MPQERGLLIKKEKEELTESVLSLKDGINELLVDKEQSSADLVTFDVKRDSLMELLTARDTVLEGLLVTVGAELDYIEFPKDSLELQKNLFGKAEDTLEERPT